MKYSLIIIPLTLFFSSLKAQYKTEKATTPYTWKSVRMVGGGFVDGIVFHPTAKGVRYCRTDIGGAYKWNDTFKRWQPLMDWVSYKDKNLMGVESIAIDPADANRVYLACGTYTSSTGPNAILASGDGGKTFRQTNVPFRMGGNENGRGNGERMAVDPDNGNVIYMGTRLDGLWKSTNGSKTWNRVNSFPLPLTTVDTQKRSGYHIRENGIIFILFDAGKNGKGNHIIYAGVSVKGQSSLFYSNDKGESWLPVADQPTQFLPTHAVLGPDGMLYIAYGTNPGPDRMTDGSVWKYNTSTKKWKDITPVKPDAVQQKLFGYAAVTIDAQHPGVVMTSTFNRYGNAGGEDIYRSIDGGESWKPVFKNGGNGSFDYSIAPYVSHTGIHWLFDLEIDPANPDHALFTTGYGGHETYNLTAVDKGKPTVWHDMSLGIEEIVSLDMLSPSRGASLISAIGDYGGFVHWNLDVSPPEGNFIDPRFANTYALANAEKDPDIIVRVGEGSTQVGGGSIGYSLNSGKSWQTTLSSPQQNSKGGTISVSANGKTWIWSPQNSPVYYTHDCGATWGLVQGLPNSIPVIADKVNPNKFYAVDVINKKLFISEDGGTVFKEQKLNITEDLLPKNNAVRDVREGSNRVYTTPGLEDDIWLAAFNGLFHSVNGGFTFTKIGDASEIHAFGFGKAAPGTAYPALYLIGNVNGINGIYRSIDITKNWVRINDDQHQWGLLLNITGDPKLYGRVYIGTHGRGILYGDPVNTN